MKKILKVISHMITKWLFSIGLCISMVSMHAQESLSRSQRLLKSVKQVSSNATAQFDVARKSASEQLKKAYERIKHYGKKYIACMQGKDVCSQKDINKARIYTGVAAAGALVVVSVLATTGGVGLYLFFKKRSMDWDEEEGELLGFSIPGASNDNSGPRFDSKVFRGEESEWTSDVSGGGAGVEQMEKQAEELRGQVEKELQIESSQSPDEEQAALKKEEEEEKRRLEAEKQAEQQSTNNGPAQKRVNPLLSVNQSPEDSTDRAKDEVVLSDKEIEERKKEFDQTGRDFAQILLNNPEKIAHGFKDKPENIPIEQWNDLQDLYLKYHGQKYYFDKATDIQAKQESLRKMAEFLIDMENSLNMYNE